MCPNIDVLAIILRCSFIWFFLLAMNKVESLSSESNESDSVSLRLKLDYVVSLPAERSENLCGRTLSFRFCIVL